VRTRTRARVHHAHERPLSPGNNSFHPNARDTLAFREIKNPIAIWRWAKNWSNLSISLSRGRKIARIHFTLDCIGPDRADVGMINFFPDTSLGTRTRERGEGRGGEGRGGVGQARFSKAKRGTKSNWMEFADTRCGELFNLARELASGVSRTELTFSICLCQRIINYRTELRLATWTLLIDEPRSSPGVGSPSGVEK